MKFLEQCSTLDDISTLLSPLMLATVWVLGAWLAEDDVSLLPEVCKVLPFVLDLALTDHRHNHQLELNPDVQSSSVQCPYIIQFILPGLIRLMMKGKVIV